MQILNISRKKYWQAF